MAEWYNDEAQSLLFEPQGQANVSLAFMSATRVAVTLQYIDRTTGKQVSLSLVVVVVLSCSRVLHVCAGISWRAGGGSSARPHHCASR